MAVTSSNSSLFPPPHLPPIRLGSVYSFRMPIVHVHVARGRPPAERRAILDGIHAALVEAFRVPDHDRNQILHEHEPEHFESGKGPSFTLVEATIFPGRRTRPPRRPAHRAAAGRTAEIDHQLDLRPRPAGAATSSTVAAVPDAVTCHWSAAPGR